MANAEACQTVLDFLLAHPENHDQKFWVNAEGDYAQDGESIDCGTVLCVAGAAYILLGGMTTWEVDDLPKFLHEAGNVQEVAARLLGIDIPEAFKLFHVMENDEALHMLKEYANG